MGALKVMPRLRYAAIAVALICFSSAASSMPFTVAGTLTGDPGDNVELALVDANVVDLEAASIKISFDPLSLTLIDVLTGDVTSGFTLVLGLPSGGSPGELLVSLASLLSPVTGVSGSLLVARFDINASAPLGQTPVVFESYDTDCEVPATTGIVIIARASMPKAVTTPLLMRGLARLWAEVVRRHLQDQEQS
jgi:hypothetical protein